MNRSSVYFKAFITLFLSSLAFQANAGWDVQFEAEFKDYKGDRVTAYEPLLRYKEDSFSTYLEYEYTPLDHTENLKKLTWQFAYNWALSEKSSVTLIHELERNLSSDITSAELTPTYYITMENGLIIGFEFEIDYLSGDKFDIYELEIEPTIKWAKKVNNGNFTLELEAPVMRLYSSQPAQKNFEFEEILTIIGYQHTLSKQAMLNVSAELPYNLQTNELNTVVNISLGYRF